MKYWLYTSSLLSYYQHRDLIGRKKKKEEKHRSDPNFSQFYGIKKFDKIIYVDRGNDLIIGLFEVNSEEMKHFSKDELYWPECDYYETKSELPRRDAHGEYLFLEAFLSDHPNLASKFSTNRTCVEIDKNLYNFIKEAYSDANYFTKVEETVGNYGPTGWRLDPDLLAGLLDYYNSRAVSFASLLVASIFGLVTLSAIIQVTFKENIQLTNNVIFSFIISVILYGLFSGAGLYMLKSYSYYTSMADKVKVHGA